MFANKYVYVARGFNKHHCLFLINEYHCGEEPSLSPKITRADRREINNLVACNDKWVAVFTGKDVVVSAMNWALDSRRQRKFTHSVSVC